MNGERRLAAFSGTAIEGEYRALNAALTRNGRGNPDEAPLAALADLGPALVSRLIEQWRARMAIEYRSSMVFGQLALQLVQAAAYLDETVVMLRLAQDELRHAGTCAEVLVGLGADPVAASLPIEPLATHRGTSPLECALRNVIFTTCISEMTACARFVAVLDEVDVPALREAIRRLLADEVWHGRFGFHFLEARADLLAHDPALRASLGRYLGHAFAVAERELAPTVALHRPNADERRCGIEDPVLAREIFLTTMEHAVVPGLDRFDLGAHAAWHTRALVATRPA